MNIHIHTEWGLGRCRAISGLLRESRAHQPCALDIKIAERGKFRHQHPLLGSPISPAQIRNGGAIHCRLILLYNIGIAQEGA